MKNRFTTAISAILVGLATTGCASSKVSTFSGPQISTHPVKSIAMAPGGGLLADAIGVELSNRGYRIIDTATSTSYLIRSEARETEFIEPRNLSLLKEKGIDAVLSVKAAAKYDSELISASARVNSTHSGQIMVGATWQNGRGLNAGSPGDRLMKKGLVDAASEIADALSQQLPM